jgi:hypothetical protein
MFRLSKIRHQGFLSTSLKSCDLFCWPNLWNVCFSTTSYSYGYFLSTSTCFDSQRFVIKVFLPTSLKLLYLNLFRLSKVHHQAFFLLLWSLCTSTCFDSQRFIIKVFCLLLWSLTISYAGLDLWNVCFYTTSCLSMGGFQVEFYICCSFSFAWCVIQSFEASVFNYFIRNNLQLFRILYFSNRNIFETYGTQLH